MANGGAREGAGRPKGAASRKDAEARAKALESGITPLEYLLSIMRDEGLPRNERIDCAKAAAPYVHAKYTTVALTGEDHQGPVEHVVRWVDETDD